MRVGSSSMLQSISSTKQYSAAISFTTTYQSSKKETILDSNNNEVISYAPTKTFSTIIISTSKSK